MSSAPSPATAGPRLTAVPSDSVVVVAEARSPAERELITAWADRRHPGAAVIPTGDGGLAHRLERGDDPLLVPARVSWLADGSSGRAADLLLLGDPGGPLRRVRDAVAKHSAHRGHVIAGESARALELRRRCSAETGRTGSAELAEFVRRQAVLANDRAERALAGDQYKVPRLVAEQILASQRVRERVAALATELERPFDDVLDDVAEGLRGLATVQSPLGEQLYRIALSPLHTRAWDVQVDVDGLERLRELNRQRALVFLPSHRSYSDPLVLNQVLHDHRFPRNHVLGGDNMAFGPFSFLGRRAGVVFIRRSFGADRAYKLAVREYLGHLVAKRFNLEWYIEGGRTRTGKLRPPRLGLLRYLADALDDGHAEDVLLVPTSIAYDQLQEVGAMATESRGTRSSVEGWQWLLRYVRAQRRNVGTVHVRFDEPFSLRSALENAGEGAVRLPKVAFRICDGINRATPVTATSLLGFVLLGVRDRALSLDQLQAVLQPLLDHLDYERVPGPIAELRRPAVLRAALDALTREGVAQCYAGGDEPVWSVTPGRHHEAAFYRNGGLHHLVKRAIVELSVLRAADEQDASSREAALRAEALRLRDLLKFEFFFPERDRFLDELDDALSALPGDWHASTDSSEAALTLLRQTGPVVAHRALRSFFDAQYVVARQLAASDPRRALERGALVDECLAVGRQLLLQGRLHGPESVSRELHAGAVRLAANRDLVDPGREPVQEARQEFLAEMEGVLARLNEIGRLDDAVLREVLDDDAR